MNNYRLYACEKCFNDKRILELIKEKQSKGDCQWCGAKDVFVISIDELGPVFRDAASIYVETGDTTGDDIGFLLQGDWEIFSDEIENNSLAHDMTIEILEAGLHPKDSTDYPDYRAYFQHAESELEEEWEERINKLLSGKPVDKVNTEDDISGRLEFACEDLARDYEKGSIFYRARIHKDRARSDKFELTELGAPPPDKTPAGRANKKGIPVLYLASDDNTALSEVRAWKGAAVAIARMKLCRRLTLIDLIEPRPSESPFFEEHLNWKIQLAGLFQMLADELSRPVMAHEQEKHYMPSQHLCDLLKSFNYDGVIFPSAMGSGHNLVLFKPIDAEPLDVTYYRVQGVRFQYELLNEYEDIYEEWPYS